MCRPFVLLLSCTAALAVADSSGATTLGQLALQKVLQDSREVFGVESDNSSQPYANWMSSVPDDTPLAHLNIPGTHDAATWNYSQATQDALAYATRCDGGSGPAPAQVYRTQRFGAAAALDAGVRFFDLRFAFDPLDRDLVFWHGAALLSARATVDDVLFAFYAWLDAHPSEAVLLSFQYEGGTKDGAEFDDAAKDKLRSALESDAAKRFVRQDSGRLGTVGESRGKIVLVRRFDMGGVEDDMLPGLHLGPGLWLDNDPDGFELVYNSTSNETAYIEDYYEPSGLGANSTVAENIQAKMGAVKAHLEKAAAAAATATGDGADSLFITFASGENDANVPHVFPQTMALGNGTEVTPDGGVNHQLVGLLREMRGSRLGVVVLDFFDEPAELVGLVLGS
ncbi:1-phosphatidylinositol phosphodiesterase [Daldinia childiae]|uniref:1-phosphatidylinositol phosphodiesterase n=1 Tax=Daldinia childiae TaxID=326645 RepID=UPI001446EACA|nr:1-phosphatidylinositol phosphodiesterase [Daldinia childiae]KAF3064857.1 1-phosphatidylinositol phosphodiesterase [Daldinia childiae]